MLLKYKGHHEQAEHFLEQVKGYSPTATQLLDHYLSNGTIVLILHLRHSVMSNKADTFSEENGLMWFDNMTSYIDSLHDVARGMADYIKVVGQSEEIPIFNCLCTFYCLLNIELKEHYFIKQCFQISFCKKKIAEQANFIEDIYEIMQNWSYIAILRKIDYPKRLYN